MNKSETASYVRPHSIAIIIALVFVTSGCTTTIFNQFHGEARNIKGGDQIDILKCEIPGYCSGPSVGGGQFVGFGLPTNGFSFFLFYPRISSHECLATNTEPPSLDAWLIRTNGYYDWSRLLKSGDPQVLRSDGGERLSGQVSVRWRDNSDFNIVVDLNGSSRDGTSVRGEFTGFTRTKFDPRSVFLGLGMVFFGEGYSSKPEQTNAPANARGDR
jgi:hypothetical protein